MNKKGLLFDFNGTMFFDSEKHREAWNVFSQKYRGCPISDYELDHTHGQTNKKIIELLLGNMSDEESERLSKAKEALYRECCVNDPAMFHLVDGLEDVLNKLQKLQVPMTICSASIKENIDFFIESFGLDRWIKPEDIVYDDGTYENKIAMFHKAADVIGIDMKDIRIYEDSNSGIRNAYDAGCEQIVVICDKENEEEFLKRPGVIEVMQDFSFAKEL